MRYCRLYLQFIKFSVGRAMEFRFDFYFRIIMDVFYYLVNIAFFKILFIHAGSLGDWTEPQAMIFVGCFIMVDAINMTLFSNNTWMIPQLVNKGDLDYYLVRPVTSFFMVNFREFAVNSFINLLMTLGFLIYALWAYPEPISLGRYVLFTILLINGAWVFHLARLLFLLPVFWTHTGRGFEMVFWSMEKFAERPHGIYKGWIRVVLMTVLPFCVMAAIPAEMIFNKNPWFYAVWGIGTGIIFFMLILLIWRIAIRGYSSASS